MASIPAIISDLEYGRAELLKSIEGLSQRELTEVPIYPGWTVKDILAHILGWDERTVQILPLILQNRASEVTGVEVEEHNRETVQAWQDKSLADVLSAMSTSHHQIIQLLAPLDHKEIDLRRDRRGRPITIRSYVLDVMIEHERQHAAEINQWRKELDQAIDPTAIKTVLARNRAEFTTVLADLNETDVLEKGAIGRWSVKDVVSHLAEWEWRMLSAARHIYDPSIPGIVPVVDDDEWNELLVNRRAANSWPEELDYWRKTSQAVDAFIIKLKPADWRLRGPYPWANDQGTIAELVSQMAEHYTGHLPELARWRNERKALKPRLKPWIRWKFDEEAAGPLKKAFAASIRRSGRVLNIVRLMSLRPSALLASMRLYTTTVRRSSGGLGRPEREMIGVVVSQLNDCPYCLQSGLRTLRLELGLNEDLVARLAENWRTAGLSEPVLAVLGFAEKLTRQPGHMSQDDVRELRRHGYNDEEILDIAQVTALFNYATRVSNALGIPPEEFMTPWPREEGDWS